MLITSDLEWKDGTLIIKNVPKELADKYIEFLELLAECDKRPKKYNL